MADNEPYITKSAQTVDYERRLALEKGELPADDTVARSFAVEGNDLSGYVGANPEYMTYADVGQAPGVADDGAEAVIENRLREAPAGIVGAVTKPEPESTDEPPKPRAGRVPSTGPGDKSGADSGSKKDGPAPA